MKVKVGEYEVFHSGVVISYENEPVVFELDTNLVIRLLFAESSEGGETKLEFKNIGTSQIDITLKNFNDTNGASLGNINPLKLGYINERFLYLNFRVASRADAKSKTIIYTWYLREPVEDVAAIRASLKNK